MKNIKKSTEPNSLAKYRNSIEIDYSKDSKIARRIFDDNPDKNTLKTFLLKEQGYICCYCMQRIEDNHHTKIEHVKPISKYQSEILNYNNLFVACNGVTKANTNNIQEGRKTTQIRHCDTSKGVCEQQWVEKKNINCDLTINPTDCERCIIEYKSDGTIRYHENVKKDIEEILNLNNNILKRNRKETLKTFIQEFNKNSKATTWSLAEIQKMLEKYQTKDEKGKYKPYCQAIISYLKKRKNRVKS